MVEQSGVCEDVFDVVVVRGKNQPRACGYIRAVELEAVGFDFCVFLRAAELAKLADRHADCRVVGNVQFRAVYPVEAAKKRAELVGFDALRLGKRLVCGIVRVEFCDILDLPSVELAQDVGLVFFHVCEPRRTRACVVLIRWDFGEHFVERFCIGRRAERDCGN